MCLIRDPEIARAIYERCEEQEFDARRNESFAAASPIECAALAHGQVRTLEAHGRIPAGYFDQLCLLDRRAFNMQ